MNYTNIDSTLSFRSIGLSTVNQKLKLMLIIRGLKSNGPNIFFPILL